MCRGPSGPGNGLGMGHGTAGTAAATGHGGQGCCLHITQDRCITKGAVQDKVPVCRKSVPFPKPTVLSKQYQGMKGRGYADEGRPSFCC